MKKKIFLFLVIITAVTSILFFSQEARADFCLSSFCGDGMCDAGIAACAGYCAIGQKCDCPYECNSGKCENGYCVANTCIPDWYNCEDWSPNYEASNIICAQTSVQYRDCTDRNNCGIACPIIQCQRTVVGTKCNAGYACTPAGCVSCTSNYDCNQAYICRSEFGGVEYQEKCSEGHCILDNETRVCTPVCCNSYCQSQGQIGTCSGQTCTCTEPQAANCNAACLGKGYMGGACSLIVGVYECTGVGNNTCNYNRFDNGHTDDCPSQWWNPWAPDCWCFRNSEYCADCYNKCAATGCSAASVGCSETDAWQEPAVPGVCTDSNGPHPDVCDSRNALTEQYCQAGVCFSQQQDCTAWMGSSGYVCDWPSGGKCIASSGCLARGIACTTDSQCCSTKCSTWSGVCYGDPPGETGAPCYDPAECQSGSCIIPTGTVGPGAPGVCAVPCEELGGTTWCNVGQSCSGTEKTSQSSDTESHRDQICCQGTCITPTQTCSVLGGASPCCANPNSCRPGTSIPGSTDCATNCCTSANCITPTQACAERQAGAQCCPLGQTCTFGRISGVPGCPECCGDIANCSAQPVCTYAACETTNIVGCKCGTTETTGLVRWCCAAADFITDNKDICEARCESVDAETRGITIIKNPLNATSFEDIIDNGIDFIFKIAIVLAPLMVVIGGFLFVTAAGNLQQLTQAKNLLIWTAVGFLVVLLSKGVLAIINQVLGVKGG